VQNGNSSELLEQIVKLVRGQEAIKLYKTSGFAKFPPGSVASSKPSYLGRHLSSQDDNNSLETRRSLNKDRRILPEANATENANTQIAGW
jgi:hypothetical protein